MEHIIKYCPQKLVVTVNICSFLRVTAQAAHPYKQQQVKFCFVRIAAIVVVVVVVVVVVLYGVM
jgi:hypothetical protein